MLCFAAWWGLNWCAPSLDTSGQFSFNGLSYKRKGWFYFPQNMWQLGTASTIKFSFYVLPHKNARGWFSFPQNMGQLGIARTINCMFYRPDVDTRFSNGVACDRAGWCTGNDARVGSSGARIDSWPGPTIRTEGLVICLSSGKKSPVMIPRLCHDRFFQFSIHQWSYGC